MTYREDFTLPAELLEQVKEQGLEVLPELIRVILNTAMQAEREQYMNAEPYQRTIGTRSACQRVQTQDDADAGGRYHLLDPTSSRRRLLPSGAGEGSAQRAGLDPGAGRDVRARCLHSQGQGDHGAVVWHFRLLGDGEPGSRPDGCRTGEMA